MYNLRITGRTPEELQKNLSAIYDSVFKGVDVVERQMKFEPTPQIEPIGKTRTATEVIESMKQPSYLPTAPAQEFVQKVADHVLPLVAAMPVFSPPPTQAPVATSEEVDSRGLPWDGRVHAETKGTNKDGSWRSRRGVDKKEVAAVEATLPRRSTQPTVAQSFPTEIPSIPTYQTPKIEVAPVHAPPIAQAPMPSYDNFAMAKKQAHDFSSFKETLIPSLAKLVKDGKLTPEYINSLKTHFGVQEIWQVNDQQCAEMFEQFATYGLINKVGG